MNRKCLNPKLYMWESSAVVAAFNVVHVSEELSFRESAFAGMRLCGLKRTDISFTMAAKLKIKTFLYILNNMFQIELINN